MVRSSCTIQHACHGEHRRWKMRRIEACSIKSHSASSPWLDLSTTEQVWVSELAMHRLLTAPPHSITMALHRIGRRCGQAVCCRIYLCSVQCAVWSVQCAVQQDEIDWSGTLSLSRQATNALEHRKRWWWWLSENIAFINYDYRSMSLGIHVLNENIFLKPWSII